MHDHTRQEMNEDRKPGLVLSRRSAIRLGAASAALVAGFRRGRRATGDCTLNPAQTEGPYWVDEPLRTAPTSGPTRRRAFSQAGLPLRLCINVSELTAGVCTPINDAWVDIWHCNATGVYSDTNAAGNGNTLGQRWLAVINAPMPTATPAS